MSLVRLEIRYNKFNSVEEALNDTLSRIHAIATVHELLSREDLDSVSIKKVAETIMHATQQSVVPPGKSVRASIEGDELFLPLNKATSLALVLNELVQNAIEHGFKSLQDGRLTITLTIGVTHNSLTVANDGEILPEGFAVRASNSLGLSIVEALVRGELNGSFTLENSPDGNGITASVVFPV